MASYSEGQGLTFAIIKMIIIIIIIIIIIFW